MPPKTREKVVGASRALPQAGRKKNQPPSQSKKPSPKPENRRITRSRTRRAPQNTSLESENRRVTRSQSKRLTQDLPAQSHTATQLTRNRPKERYRKKGEVASLDPSRVLTSEQAQGVSSWLDEVQLAPIEEVRTFDEDDSGSNSEPNSIMETTSSSVSGVFSDNSSTAKPRARPHQDILDKLRTRRALPDKLTADGKTKELKSALGIQEAITVPYKDTKTLQAAITKFLQKAQQASPREDSYAAIEDLSNEINEWKSTVCLATITNQDFEKDLAHSEHSNEAVFQRTAMMSVIDRWRLNDMFDFNCEGHWSLQGKYPLPSTQGLEDKVAGPKPDLAIFFNTESLLGSDGFSAPIPPALKSCIFPDGYVRRCFPFVFIEAKKAFHDITPAVYANMHSASQALFNIYTWMRKADHTDAFFKNVRLFSVTINAEKVLVRTHRAKALDSNKGLVFLCDELCTLYRYSRDDVCLLIRNILSEYGAKELRDILKSTVEEVSQRYKEGTFQSDDELPKRKNDASLGAPAKKHRASNSASQHAFDPSSSFGVSRISI